MPIAGSAIPNRKSEIRRWLGPHAEPLARWLGGKGEQAVQARPQPGVVLGQHEDGIVLRAEGFPCEGQEGLAAARVVVGQPLGEDALGEGRLDEPALAAPAEDDGVLLDDEARLDEAAAEAVILVVPLRVEGHKQAVEVGDAGPDSHPQIQPHHRLEDEQPQEREPHEPEHEERNPHAPARRRPREESQEADAQEERAQPPEPGGRQPLKEIHAQRQHPQHRLGGVPPEKLDEQPSHSGLSRS